VLKVVICVFRFRSCCVVVLNTRMILDIVRVYCVVSEDSKKSLCWYWFVKFVLLLWYFYLVLCIVFMLLENIL